MLGATDTSNGTDVAPAGMVRASSQPLRQVFENGQRIFRKVQRLSSERVNFALLASRLGKTRWSRQPIRGLS